VVTNGQVPYWLNVEHPQLSIITHEDIFTNKSHLPTFSSPAIESHLHQIPGIADHFIYFNDDVMLGVPISPDHFKTASEGTNIYLSWPVPNCNQGCHGNWLGDGRCDHACNVSSCLFDYGDCVNATSARGAPSWGKDKHSSSVKDDGSSRYCVKTCPDNWIGDRVRFV
jgi:UDP-N-acetylglucosamine-lysosomal-enzyme